jgi:1-deoxy-D-xylulose-5-phosphate synthase
VAIRYPRGEAVGVPVDDEFREIPLGTWELLKEGGDIAIIACGVTVYPSLEAARELEEEGIHCSVVNGRFIKPIDAEMLSGVAERTGRILTVEENTTIGGFGSAVSEMLAEIGLVVPVKHIGLPDAFLPHGSQTTLRKKTGLDKEGIKEAVTDWLKSG